MSKIIEIFGGFKSEDERIQFIESQFVVITNLTKENDKLKAEKKHLEDLLKQATPITPIVNDDPRPLEERICLEQLQLLKEVSGQRELTAEESRKVETYFKILFQLKGNKKSTASSVDNMPIGDLLKLVKNDDVS